MCTVASCSRIKLVTDTCWLLFKSILEAQTSDFDERQFDVPNRPDIQLVFSIAMHQCTKVNRIEQAERRPLIAGI
eukprot:3734693-Pleurochrysis_carterae.AAC.1